MRTVRVLTVADIHYLFSKAELEELKSANEDCDVCFLLGDIPSDELRLIRDTVHLPMCGVLGNHDVHGMLEKEQILDCSGKVVDVAGMRVAGLEGSPRYNDDRRHVMLSQYEAKVMVDAVNDEADGKGIDVFLSHSGLYDGREDVAHSGFKAIDKLLDKQRPSIMLHGHDHESKQGKYRSIPLLIHGKLSIPVISTFRVEKHELQIK